ncbi:MAG: glucodextranase DOMON-like domain-containing protein [Candidatus Ozemobacteraceae bacterium]
MLMIEKLVHLGRRLGIAGAVTVTLVTGLFSASPAIARDIPEPVNFFRESGALLDIEDPVLDDKGPGFYTYPLDSRLPRGIFDLTRFYVYEEGQVVTFVIQMRTNILTRWPDTGKGEEQGFVANLFDIYIDTDGRPGTGHKRALPGRDVEFADGMGWEKAILVTPLSQYEVLDTLQEKTDDPEFMNTYKDIIVPDYVQVQRDRIVIKINKEFLGNPTSDWGYQIFCMGFRRIASPNQLYNYDVRAFATKTTFGGGWDTYGDPLPIDIIMPEGKDQYECLKEYRSQPFRNLIQYAKVPFVFGAKVRKSTDSGVSLNGLLISEPAPTVLPENAVQGNASVVRPPPRLPPVPTVPAAPMIMTSPDTAYYAKPTTTGRGTMIKQPVQAPTLAPTTAPAILLPDDFVPTSGKNTSKQIPTSGSAKTTAKSSTAGFQPLSSPKASSGTTAAMMTNDGSDGFKPLPKPTGFQPLGKR